jgi:hypothetical protein
MPMRHAAPGQIHIVLKAQELACDYFSNAWVSSFQMDLRLHLEQKKATRVGM